MNLDDDTLDNIFSHLSPLELVSVGNTCQRLHSMVKRLIKKQLPILLQQHNFDEIKGTHKKCLFTSAEEFWSGFTDDDLEKMFVFLLEISKKNFRFYHYENSIFFPFSEKSYSVKDCLKLISTRMNLISSYNALLNGNVFLCFSLRWWQLSLKIGRHSAGVYQVRLHFMRYSGGKSGVLNHVTVKKQFGKTLIDTKSARPKLLKDSSKNDDGWKQGLQKCSFVDDENLKLWEYLELRPFKLKSSANLEISLVMSKYFVWDKIEVRKLVAVS